MRIKTTHSVPAIEYSHFHDTLSLMRKVTMAGPMMAPTPKNPSTKFMVEVCCAVEDEISPISASAPVLNMPMAAPDTVSRQRKNANVLPRMNR